MIPRRVKRVVNELCWSGGLFLFRRGMRATVVFRLLSAGWANDGWAGDVEYLQAVCRLAAQTPEQILECGSGLSTILLGLLAPGRVLSLEHLPEWKQTVERVAKRHSIQVGVEQAALVDYGEYQWYALPPNASAKYGLVVCDGPPGSTLGGRYGLMPVARSRFTKEAVILMDDVERPNEQDIIRRWKSEYGVECEEHRSSFGTYAVVRPSRNHQPH